MCESESGGGGGGGGAVQQYVGSRKPATDGRSDETELEFPLAFMRFVSRELVLPRRCLQMSRRQLVCIISSVRHVDWTTVLVMHYPSTYCIEDLQRDNI